MAKMEESQIRSIVLAYVEECLQFSEDVVGYRRAACYNSYWQREYGNEAEGRSRVISADVAQHIDTAIPQIIKAFVSTDRAVEFVPRKSEDVQGAEQTTDACNYIFYSQNSGFQLAHDCIKDGLLQITGMFKWVWEEKEEEKEETYMGLDDGSFTMLTSDPAVEVTAHSAIPLQGPPNPDGSPGQVMTLHNVTVSKKKTAGKIKIYVVPPEEQLIYPRSNTMDVYDQTFIGHMSKKTISELVEMGYKKSELEDIETTSWSGMEQEKIARKTRQGSVYDSNSSSADDSQRLVDYAECYVRVDYDGDGVAELRRVCLGGTKVLHNEECEHIPLCYWSPKVMSHEPIGMSMAEELYDLQYTKSMLWRQSLDSLYLAVNPRVTVVEGQCNIDDILTVRPGGIVRMNQPGMVSNLEIPFVGQQAFPMLEYLDAEAESRTGVSRLMQAMDPTSINKTATGVNALMNAAQARMELVSRNFAELAMKPLFKGIVYLLQEHQQEPLIARIRNKFVPIDPGAWKNEYDMTINVGLGTGTKDQQLQHLMALGMDMQAIGASPFGSQLLDAKKIYNYVEKKAELMGFKDASIFVNNPEGKPTPPPPKPPEVQVAEIQTQALMQSKQVEQQGKAMEFQAKTQAEAQSAQQDSDLKRSEMQMQAELEKYKADLKAQTEIQVAQIRESLINERELQKMQLEHQRGMSQAEANAKPHTTVQFNAEDKLGEVTDHMKFQSDAVAHAISNLAEALSRPKQIVRGKDGRAVGVQ